MRLQLILVFALIILIAVGTSWFLAVRTTGNEFAVLVSESNQRQAAWLAPFLASEYQKLGSWQAIQDEFDAQVDLERTWATTVNGAPIPRTGHPISWARPSGFSILREDGTVLWNFTTSLSGSQAAAPSPASQPSLISQGAMPAFSAGGIQLLPAESAQLPAGDFVFGNFVADLGSDARPWMERLYVYQLDTSAESVALVVEPSVTSLVAILARRDNQRAIIVDNAGKIAVDSEKALVGEAIDHRSIKNGVPLYANQKQIGTLVVTSPDGIYTLEQSFFLEQVRAGLLYGGLISAGLALILAFMMADRITRPIRSLMTATAQIQAGEWGYQVSDTASSRTEIGQLREAFNQMSRHLADQRRLRGRLVDDLAHELNTPLSLMRLEIQAMLDGMQSSAEAGEHLNQELDEVAGLVSDLIFLASRDTARLPHMDWVDLNDLVATTLRRFEGSATLDLTLNFEPAAKLPPLYADADLVQRAVSNLISNALRYTLPGGTITLKTRQNGLNLEVLVQDTGVGIAEEHLPYIFERFYRVDDSRNRLSGGRGLGLAIVKQIMEQHRGSVRVESLLGRGSTFTLVWPAAMAS
jgi:two-component system sensor histidine kinase BaeS